MPSTRKSQIGIHISDDSIEIVEISGSRGGNATLRAYSHIALDKGVISHGRVEKTEAFSEALKQAYKTAQPNSFSSPLLHLALPDMATYFHVFQFPGYLSDQEIESALAFQLEEVIPFTVEQMQGDFFVAERSAKQTVVHYAMVPREVLQPYKEAFNLAGLKLASVRMVAQSLDRALAIPAVKGKAQVIVDIETDSATTFIRTDRGLQATFSQVLPDGPSFAETAPEGAKVEKPKRRAGALTKTSIKALATRVKEAVHWFHEIQHDIAIDRVLLTGMSAQSEEIVAAVQTALKKEGQMVVEQVDPYQRLTATDVVKELKRLGNAASFAVAAGVAMVGNKPEVANFDLSRKRSVHSRLLPGDLIARSFSFVTLPFHRNGDGFLEGTGITVVQQRTKVIIAGSFFTAAVLALVFSFSIYTNRQNEVTASKDAFEDSLVNLESADFQLRIGEGGDIAGSVFTSEHEEVVTVFAADGEESEGIARGEVELVNEKSVPQALVANTRLLSEEGILFRLDEAVEIPAGETVVASVYADQAGEDGDIEATSFTIPGLSEADQEAVYASSNEPMRGGLVITGTFSIEDFDEAVEEASQSLKANLATYFGDQLSDDLLIPEAWRRVEVVSAESSVEEGESFTQADVRVRFVVSATGYTDSEVEQYLRSHIATALSIDPGSVGPINFQVQGAHLEENGETVLRLHLDRYPQTDSAGE